MYVDKNESGQGNMASGFNINANDAAMNDFFMPDIIYQISNVNFLFSLVLMGICFSMCYYIYKSDVTTWVNRRGVHWKKSDRKIAIFMLLLPVIFNLFFIFYFEHQVVVNSNQSLTVQRYLFDKKTIERSNVAHITFDRIKSSGKNRRDKIFCYITILEKNRELTVLNIQGIDGKSPLWCLKDLKKLN